MQFILASQSPRRQELLAKITPTFKVVPFSGNENIPEGLSPLQAVEYLARLKTSSVGNNFPDDIVIGADTIVVLNNKILGKPSDKADCVRMLSELSGNVHMVYTGVAVLAKGELTSFVSESSVEFYPMTDAEIQAYANMDEPYDKAGSYGIQGHGALFVKRINGDYFNIMGLPTAELYRHLGQRGLLP